MPKSRRLTVAIAIAALAAATTHATATMFVVDSVNNLATIDLTTGHVEIVGSTAAQFTDIAFSPTGCLYGITPRYLYEIDPATGWSTLIGDHGYGDPMAGYGLDALAFGADGVLYAAGNDILISIDPVTGAGATVGGLSGYRSAGDLAADAAGGLVASTDSGHLIRVATDGSGASVIGSLPYSDVYALATGGDGQFYGVRSTNELLAIDGVTGSASVVTPLDADFLFGYAWGGSIPPAHTPEPATLALWCCGAAAIACRRPLAARASASTFQAQGANAGSMDRSLALSARMIRV